MYRRIIVVPTIYDIRIIWMLNQYFEHPTRCKAKKSNMDTRHIVLRLFVVEKESPSVPERQSLE